MALDARQLSKSQLFEIEKVKRFEELARDAWDKPWWREFVTLITERNQSLLMTLAIGMNDQREEDRLRGQILAFSWIITLDKQAVKNEKENHNGRS